MSVKLKLTGLIFILVTGLINSTNDYVRKIEGESSNVISSIEDMLRVSTHSAAATEEIAATVSNQNTSIETVNKEVESLIETVNNLKNSLTKFSLS